MKTQLIPKGENIHNTGYNPVAAKDANLNSASNTPSILARVKGISILLQRLAD